MAYIEPNTEVRFLHGVPLDPDYENTLYFDTKEQQTNYFLNKAKHTFSNQSYQRKNRGWLRVGFPADVYGGSVIRDLYNSTYMMFKNSNYENKWFYAFVDKVEYVNNNTVDVQYHIDVMQTWHFDYVLNQCFIERQHSVGDYAGINTVPETLETGPYVSEIPTVAVDGGLYDDGMFHYTPKICLVTTFNSNGSYASGYLAPALDNQGLYFTGVNYYLYNATQAGVDSLNSALQSIVQDSAAKEGVLSLMMVPGDFFVPAGQTQKTLYLENVSKLGTYAPRNKKLLTYPYNMLTVYTPYGHNAEYKYEDFDGVGSRIAFQIWGNISSNPGMLCAPKDYKNVDGINYEEQLTITGFPMCSWSYDSFKAWLAQNSGTLAAGAIGLVGKWAVELADPIGGLISGDMGINRYGLPYVGAHTMMGQHAGGGYEMESPATGGLLAATLGAVGQIYDHSRVPPQSKGNNNGDLNYQAGRMTFHFVQKHIKLEYALIIDDYFDMYGYAIHRNGVPNRAARRCYTYVKTIGCSIHGDLPSDDIIAIQNLFNRGIRFWRHTAVFGNYDPSVNNNQV